MVLVWLFTAAVLVVPADIGAQGLSYFVAEADSELADGPGSGGGQSLALDRLETLNLLSAGLVEKAGSGSSPAKDFRIEARLYRESLRQLMLENRGISPEDRIHESLFLEMVRMSALLHAAADCKTGKFITCPPDLMVQLTSQQAILDRLFAGVLPARQREAP